MRLRRWLKSLAQFHSFVGRFSRMYGNKTSSIPFAKRLCRNAPDHFDVMLSENEASAFL